MYGASNEDPSPRRRTPHRRWLVVPILVPIAFGLLGALLLDGTRDSESFGAVKPGPVPLPTIAKAAAWTPKLPAGSKTRFKPLVQKKRKKRRAQVLANAFQQAGTEDEEPVQAEGEDQADEALDPYEAASRQIDTEVEIEQIGDEVADDMFGFDIDFGGKRHGHKIGWPHTYRRGQGQ